MGLRARLLNVVLNDLPTPTSKLAEPDPRWDHLLGGRLGAGRWKRFELGHGTSCGATLDGWLADVQAPPELIDAAPEDGGSGYTIGASISRLISGAKKLGWLRRPERGVLPNVRPGDAYHINRLRDDGIDGSHVGVILRATPSADGQSLEVETADGGQANNTATRSVRTFKLSAGLHSVTVQSPSSSGWLEEWVAIGGDEPDDVSDAPGGGDGAGFPVAQVALGAAGLLMLAGAAWLFASTVKADRLHAVREVPGKNLVGLAHKWNDLLFEHGRIGDGGHAYLGWKLDVLPEPERMRFAKDVLEDQSYDLEVWVREGGAEARQFAAQFARDVDEAPELLDYGDGPPAGIYAMRTRRPAMLARRV